MSTILPEGEALRKAIKWISSQLEEMDQPEVKRLVNEAIAKFNLNPKDAAYLINFYKNS